MMSQPIVFSLMVFACAFGGALLGMAYRKRLPPDHLCSDSRDTIKLGVGLIATMAALVLGLLTATAKGSFDMADKSIRETAMQVIALDRTLAEFGPPAAGIRQFTQQLLANRVAVIWPEHGQSGIRAIAGEKNLAADQLARQVRVLVPENDEQRWLQSRANTITGQIMESRWLLLASLRHAVALPFLVALVLWLGITFASFGLLAPRNGTVVGIIFLCAVSVSSAVFLILELDGPFDGVVRVSSQPLVFALEQINK